MPDITMKPVRSTKSHFLNEVLNVRNQYGADFQRNIREGLVITDRGHAIWFTIPKGGLNRFFRQDGAWFVEETLSENRDSWGDRVQRKTSRLGSPLSVP